MWFKVENILRHPKMNCEQTIWDVGINFLAENPALLLSNYFFYRNHTQIRFFLLPHLSNSFSTHHLPCKIRAWCLGNQGFSPSVLFKMIAIMVNITWNVRCNWDAASCLMINLISLCLLLSLINVFHAWSLFLGTTTNSRIWGWIGWEIWWRRAKHGDR